MFFDHRGLPPLLRAPQLPARTRAAVRARVRRHDVPRRRVRCGGPAHHRAHHRFADTDARSALAAQRLLVEPRRLDPVRQVRRDRRRRDQGLRPLSRAALAQQARLDRPVVARHRVLPDRRLERPRRRVLRVDDRAVALDVPRELGSRTSSAAVSYETTDTSRNSLLIALVTGGEGWHNNHHRYPSSARQGFRWWQIDTTYYGLRLLAVLGIVKDLRRVPGTRPRRSPIPDGATNTDLGSGGTVRRHDRQRTDRLPRRARRDRAELLLPRGRRAHPRRRLRAHVPRRRHARRRPRAPRLHVSCARTRERVEAVLLTHAHEDHAGGLAFLLRDISVPIYGSALSLALARNRIEEAGMLDRTELIPVHDGERRQIGPFDCQFIPVTHSVPHGFATAFFTPAGTIVHTGDFKLDLTPVDGRRTDLALLGELARRDGGVRLLLSDSTNAEQPGFTPSESTVGCRDAFAVPRAPDEAVHRHELRVAPAPRAAGRAGRGRARPARRVRRAFDGAERRAGARTRVLDLPAHAVHRHRGNGAVRARRRLHHLHRFAGRADERAVADGRARAQAREGLRRRRRGDQRARDPRQRVERLARDRLAPPRRRRGRARPQRRRCTCPATRRRKS